jgi:hypothetical protein
MTLASHLHMSLARCQEETSYFEFLQWMEFLREDAKDKFKRFEKQDFYLSQIAAVIVAANCKDPKKIKIKDFYLHLPEEEKEKKKLTKEERTAIAKKFWMRIPNRKGRLPKDKI